MGLLHLMYVIFTSFLHLYKLHYFFLTPIQIELRYFSAKTQIYLCGSELKNRTTLTLEIPRSASHAEYQGVIKLITQKKNYCVTPN
jgi:hypothetical protein